MIRALLRGTICLLLGTVALHAMNGKVVSVQFRSGDNIMENGVVPGGKPPVWIGSLVKYTIVNNAVTRCDTLHGRKNGFAEAPIWSLDGQKVAFYRWGAYDNSGQLGGVNTADYVAYVNADGSGLTNLCQLPVHPQKNLELAWPAGDWIYYEKPTNKDLWNPTTMEIWRVNFRTKANELAYSYPRDAGKDVEYIWHFTLSASGNRAGIQIINGANNYNSVYSFLASNLTVTNSHSLYGCGSCNAAVSASGHFINSFGGNAPGYPHPQQNICTDGGGGRPSGDIPNADRPTTQQMIQWSGTTCLRGGVNSNVSDWGSEKIFWSANSDKWCNQRIWDWGDPGKYNHSMASNWVDHQAVLCQMECGSATRGNTSGQLWVDNPTQNPNGDKIEDIAGNWRRVVPGTDPMTGTSAIIANSQLRIDGLRIYAENRSITVSLPQRFSIEIADVQGRIAFMRSAQGKLSIGTDALAPGSYIIHLRAGASIVEKAVTIGL